MGKYDFYKKSSNDWPVYEKNGGTTPQYLYLSNMGYWSVSLTLKFNVIKSSTSSALQI